MARAHRTARRIGAPLGVLLTLFLGVAGSASWMAPSSAATTTSTSSRSQPLKAPKTSVQQDSKFFSEVTEADPSLESYEQKRGNVALEALLTDGSAFCALLKHGGGIDEALVAEAEGVRSTETQTSLPLSVTTFNAIESTALLALCPSEQRLVPASVRSKLHRLQAHLSH